MSRTKFQSEPTIPEGMLKTIHGHMLPDCGRSRLTAMLQEAYELHNTHVVMRVDGGAPETVELTNELLLDLEPSRLGSVDLGGPASMSIEQIDEGGFRLTEVLESWQGVPRVSTLRFEYDNLHAHPPHDWKG